MKKLLKIFLILLVIAGLGSVAAYFLAKKYEPEVRTIVLYELNRYLDVEVKVDDINFSLLQRFPYASLRFSHVVIPEAKKDGESDTLIYIEDLYLQIGLIDFLSKNYRVTEAELNEGFFRVEEYAEGSNNYSFWKSAADSASNASLSLTNIELKQFEFRLRKGPDLELLTFVNSADADGDFGAEIFDIKIKTDLELNLLISSGDTLFRKQSISGTVGVKIDQAKKMYGFKSESIELGKEAFKLDGAFNTAQDVDEWNLELTTENAKIEHLLELMPIWLVKRTNSYKARGKTDLQLVMNSKPESLQLDVLFERTRGSFQHQVALGTTKISDAAGSIQIRNNTTSLYLDRLRMGIGPGEISAFGKIIDFDSPSFDLSLEGAMDLEEFKNFIQIPLAERLEGKVSMHGRLHGKLPSTGGDQTLQFLKGIGFDGDISLEKGAFKIKDQSPVFENVGGLIELNENALIVNSGSGEVNGNPFEINGIIKNALPFISTTGQKLHIDADFSSSSIDLNAIWAAESSRKDTVYSFSLPENVSFDLGVEIGEIYFRRFEAKELRGKAYCKNGFLTLNPFSFKTASGRVKASATVAKKSESTFKLGVRAELQGIKIDQLFYAFEDFGQNTVRSSHLEGQARSDIYFTTNFGSDLSIDLPTVESEISLVITDGKLKKMESLQAIADYLRSNTLWRTLVKVDAFEKKIQTVAFDTLQNTIKIADEKVLIPAMTIGSSAMNIGLSGRHTFNNEIDYSINFKLRELLRTDKSQSDEFGYIIEDSDGLRLFMRMTGTTENPVFSMDAASARSKRKAQLEEEKNLLKRMLKEEFGLFKSDSTLESNPQVSPRPKTKFEVEWGEFDKADSSTTIDLKKKKTTGKPSKGDNDLYDALEEDDDL